LQLNSGYNFLEKSKVILSQELCEQIYLQGGVIQYESSQSQAYARSLLQMSEVDCWTIDKQVCPLASWVQFVQMLTFL